MDSIQLNIKQVLGFLQEEEILNQATRHYTTVHVKVAIFWDG